MPLLERVLGDIEIQERRPKSWMEPRRKRLSFVRPHNPSHSRHSSSSSSKSDEWALAPARGDAQFYRNDAETWDLRRHEAQARFSDAEIRHRDLEHRQRVHYIHQLYGPPPDLQRIHDHGHEQGLLEGGIQTIRPRGHHGDSDDEIIEVVSLGSDDGFDDHHHRPRHEPLSIEQDRDRGRVLRDLMGKEVKRGKSKDKHGKGKKGGTKKGKGKSHDDDSDSSDDEKKVFMEGVKAGTRVSRERGGSHGHGGGSDRGSPRTRRRFVREVESDDSMDFRPRRQSRSRGRLGWGL